jgi:FkbM family methyltransferase
MLKSGLASFYKKAFAVLAGRGLGKLSFVRKINRFIASRLRSPSAEVDGHKMLLDSRDSLGISIKGIYDPGGTAVVKKAVKPGDIVLDIGANIGYYTLIFARLAGETGKVYAFEPEPANFSILKKNVEMNGYKNVVLVQKAVSNRNGKTRLYLASGNTSDHRIYDSQDGRRYIDVETIQLDDYFSRSREKINFIKMDIQGAEGLALQGMTGLLNNSVDLKVMMEFCPAWFARLNIDPADTLNGLTACGFQMFEIGAREKSLRPVNTAGLLREYTAARKNSTNLLLVKGN